MPSSTKQSLLWRIEGEGLPGVSYLFGTMHVRDQRVFRSLASVYAAIATCTAFAAEFALDSASEVSMPALLRLPDGVALDQLLPAKKWTKLQKMLQKTVGIQLSAFNHFKPLLISNLIEEKLLTSDMPYSLDEHLWRYASSLDKEMKGIETLAAQIEILQQLPLEQQLQGLLGTMRNFSRYRQHLLKMANWYEQGDIIKLYQATKRGTRDARRLLLYDRNVLMANRIAIMAKTQTTFCAVGAAHLAGQKGILYLLKRQGLRVQPILLETSERSTSSF